MDLNKIKKIIIYLESSKIPFIYFILTFFFAITLRIFLEVFSDHTLISFNTYSHFYLSWLYIGLCFIILFYYATKEKIKKVERFILPSFLVLILTPIFDLIFSLGKGYNIGYLKPGIHENLLLRFITFGGSFNGTGITPGIKIEVILILAGSFIYFLIKKQSILRSLLFSFFTYSLIFIFGIMPFIIKGFLALLKIEYYYSAILMRNFYLLLILILGIWLFYLHNKRHFIELLKDSRILRLLHFELMFILGMLLANNLYPNQFQLTQNTLFSLIFIIISIGFASFFSIITNNLTDYEIDKISNKERPLVSNKIKQKDYKQLAWFFLALSIVYASTVNFKTLFLILLCIGNYFLYSMPPLRLKRIPFFSKLIISTNSLILLMVGYNLIVKSVEISPVIIFFFLIFFTAVINFIDIKDYRGDKQAKIKTLPTIFGLRKSKIIIGAFFFVSYLYLYLILKNTFILVFLFIFGAIEFFLINKKNYNEKPIFIVYLFSLVMLIIYLIL